MRKRRVGLTLLGRALVWRLLGIISRHSELWEKLFTLCHSVLDVIHGVEVSSCELCYVFGGCTAGEELRKPIDCQGAGMYGTVS